MTTTNQNIRTGVRFPILGVLFCIFLTLKLCGVIAWSWLWVFAPLWIPLAIAVTGLFLLGLIALADARDKA